MMRSFEIKLFIDEIEQTLQVQEEKTPAGTYLINRDQKFVARIFKDTDGQWKSVEVTDQSPSVIQAIGQEIERNIEQ